MNAFLVLSFIVGCRVLTSVSMHTWHIWIVVNTELHCSPCVDLFLELLMCACIRCMLAEINGMVTLCSLLNNICGHS